MPDWSIVISDESGSVTLDPNPQNVLSGDQVFWSNRTNNSQTITIDGQAGAAPMVAPPWDSSSPAYKITTPTPPQDSYAYTVKPTDSPTVDGVKGTITIKAALTVLLVVLLGGVFAPPLQAQQQDCSDLFGKVRELVPIPEIGRTKTQTEGPVVGTLITTGESQYIAFNKGGFKSGDLTTADITCAKQWVRAYRSGALIPPDPSQGPNAPTTLPLPGPTIRARVGDLVELTFMNLIDRLNFPGTDTGKCDEAQNNTGQIYPRTLAGGDVPPNCFHGSIFTNVHYHGTHTSPKSTADNVFLEIVPWSRENNQSRARTMPPDFNDTVLKDTFRDFFTQCEQHLNLPDRAQQWPVVWEDLPETYRKMQEALLSKAFPKLWDDNQKAITAKRFPPNYIGAFPYCFRLPVYTGSTYPPASAGTTSDHAAHGDSPAPLPPLNMGQAPGTHWYHAHKHGSTTINVSNGMTGLVIIEGVYDDEINAYYKAVGGIDQKVMVLNQLGVTPNRSGGNMPAPGNYYSVNGRLQPTITMKPGEVQWWRIANTSSRSGLIFTVPAGLQWRQLAIDGVQFVNKRYEESENKQFVLASGNRVDLLVFAPLDAKGKIPVKAVLTTDPLTNTSSTQQLFNVVVDTAHGTRNMGFMDRSKTYFPPFLKDILKGDVNGYNTITFATNKNKPSPEAPTPIFNRHTINGKQFHGEVSVKVDLNNIEEWTILNASYNPKIAHPFHIHINPFQITEEFEPNALLSSTPVTGKTVSTAVVQGKNVATGTDFNTTFRVGDFITIAGEAVANVVSIAEDGTSLVFAFANGSAAKGVSNAAYTVGIPLYTTNAAPADQHPGQCYINPAVESSWHPCEATEPPEGDGRKWWDTFSIPSGQTFFTKGGASTGTQIPGYFKMRSRFVDYGGHFVTHCHILAHEDRGMMTGVVVGPEEQLPESHH